MKRILLLAFCLFLSLGLFAQTAQDDGTVEVFYATDFKITPPLRDMMDAPADIVGEDLAPKPESRDREHRFPYMYFDTNPEALPLEGEDPALQREMGTKMLLSPILNFLGQNGNGTPPDPTGSAGLNHYVQAVNCAYRVYDKTTGIGVGAAKTLGSLLFGVNDGDPIVLYDKFADRWFISQFGISGNKVYIAISQTGDPTGAYYTWQWTSAQFPDYLKFSIWHDGYYMTSNQSTNKVLVFERSQMIVGATSPRMISKTYSPPDAGGFFCPLPGDADGQLPPAGTPCPIISFEDDGWGSAYDDAVNVYEMTTTWGTTPAATITLAASLIAQAFDASYNVYWNDITQPNSSQKLDGIGGVFTFRAQHRCWTGYNSVVLNMGVKVSSTQRSIRWFELRKNTSTNTWSIHQQGTYAPDGLNRWCGSIAMDDMGSIALCYSVSGTSPSNVYPSLRYTGRNAWDPAGQMTYAEQTAQAGTSAQAGTNRWGDYSHTAVDPADGTLFWHTGEYYSSGQKTRIYSFRIPIPAGIESAAAEAGIKVFQNGTNLIIQAEKLPSDNEMVVDLFDINGKKINGLKVKAENKTFETSINVSGLAVGTYLVRVGEMNTNFQKVVKVVIQ
jgi:hypothetical protein